MRRNAGAAFRTKKRNKVPAAISSYASRDPGKLERDLCHKHKRDGRPNRDLLHQIEGMRLAPARSSDCRLAGVRHQADRPRSATASCHLREVMRRCKQVSGLGAPPQRRWEHAETEAKPWPETSSQALKFAPYSDTRRLVICVPIDWKVDTIWSAAVSSKYLSALEAQPFSMLDEPAITSTV